MVRPRDRAYGVDSSADNHPHPNDHTASRVVDLRLAESYVPLWLCLVKTSVVVWVHVLMHPTQAHVLCVSLLTIDRLGAVSRCCGCVPSSSNGCRVQENIVDSNAIAWAVFCAFLVLFNTESEAEAPLNRRTPLYVSVVFGAWAVLSAAHLTYGGVCTCTGLRS